MLRAYKYRLYPNSEQKEYFAKTFGCSRLIYNLMLADRIKSYEENKDLDIKKIKYPTPAQYKKKYEFLKEVDSLALANEQINLDKDTVINECALNLQKSLEKSLSKDAKIIDKKIEEDDLGNGKIIVKITFTVEQDIAEKVW